MRLNDRGIEAAGRGDYAEAEKALSAALKLVDKSDPFDERLPRTLTNLGAVYHGQGRYDEAEPLYRRALAIFEKAVGAGHPDSVTTMKNYALLLRRAGRAVEAEALESRAARSGRQ